MVVVDLPTFPIKLNHSCRIHIRFVPMIRLGTDVFVPCFFVVGSVDWFDPLRTSSPCNSYPAIGEVAGFPETLSVVVTPGVSSLPMTHGVTS